MTTAALPRPLTLPRRIPRALHPWLALAALAGIDALLVAATGVTLTMDPHRGLLFALQAGSLLAVLCIYRCSGRSVSLSACAEMALLFLTLAFLAGLWSTLSVLATQRPCIDAMLHQADTWLGFDYVAWFTWCLARPWLWQALDVAYVSTGPQLMLLLVLLPLWQPHRSRELFWALLLALGVIVPISGLWPSHSAWVEYAAWVQVPPEALGWYGLWQHAHTGTLTSLDWTQIEGMITFPSFHTVHGIVCTWAVRRTRLLWLFVPLNAVMLMSVPPRGGHYLVDVLAGIVVAVGAIWGARRIVGEA